MAALKDADEKIAVGILVPATTNLRGWGAKITDDRLHYFIPFYTVKDCKEVMTKDFSDIPEAKVVNMSREYYDLLETIR